MLCSLVKVRRLFIKASMSAICGLASLTVLQPDGPNLLADPYKCREQGCCCGLGTLFLQSLFTSWFHGIECQHFRALWDSAVVDTKDTTTLYPFDGKLY
jgi:hypothetical protein